MRRGSFVQSNGIELWVDDVAKRILHFNYCFNNKKEEMEKKKAESLFDLRLAKRPGHRAATATSLTTWGPAN
jgi:hypothetical protein